MKIVYRDDEGRVCVVFPTEEALQRYSLDKIAKLSVPKGFKYGFIEEKNIPNNEDERDAWEIEDEFLNQGVGEA